MMEKTIAKRVGERLQDYYPDQDYIFKGLERVATKSGSSVYRVRLHSATPPKSLKRRQLSELGHRELYAKVYQEGAGPNIHEMMGLTAFHNLFLVPRILDYYDDYEGGILISEGVTGQTLTRALLKNTFFPNKNLISCSKMMGWAIGALQNMTPRGPKRVGDLDLYLIKEIASEDYFKKILKGDLLKDLRAEANELRTLTTRVAQHHGDPSPHNILMKNGRVYLLDYSFQDSATFIDPSLYLVSLELMNARYGLPVRETVLRMKKEFKTAYSQMTKETYDRPIWTIVKKLNYLHFLLMYAKRKKTIKNTLVASVDRRYLLKKVRE